jgi:hypothetical protein
MKCLIYFFFFLLSSPLSYGVGQKTTKAMTGRQRKLHEILFPNKTKPYDYNDEQSSFFKRSSSLPSSSSSEVANRMLLPDLSNPPDGVSDALCEVCRGLTYCSALNGLLIQEVYYPSSNSEFGTCTIIDSLGERMYNEIFGIGRTFRDTPQCRLIVMQYLCLFWGTENDMYRNLCFWKEETQDPDPTKHKVTGRPPCRSFCVQVNTLLALPFSILVRSLKSVQIKKISLTSVMGLFAHQLVMSAPQVTKPLSFPFANSAAIQTRLLAEKWSPPISPVMCLLSQIHMVLPLEWRSLSFM